MASTPPSEARPSMTTRRVLLRRLAFVAPAILVLQPGPAAAQSLPPGPGPGPQPNPPIQVPPGPPDMAVGAGTVGAGAVGAGLQTPARATDAEELAGTGIDALQMLGLAGGAVVAGVAIESIGRRVSGEARRTADARFDEAES